MSSNIRITSAKGVFEVYKNQNFVFYLEKAELYCLAAEEKLKCIQKI